MRFLHFEREQTINFSNSLSKYVTQKSVKIKYQKFTEHINSLEMSFE